MSVFRVFLVLNFSHSDWIWRDTPTLSVFSPNAGKYGPEKLRIRTLFMQRIALAELIKVIIELRWNVRSIHLWMISECFCRNGKCFTYVEQTKFEQKVNFEFVLDMEYIHSLNLISSYCHDIETEQEYFYIMNIFQLSLFGVPFQHSIRRSPRLPNTCNTNNLS